MKKAKLFLFVIFACLFLFTAAVNAQTAKTMTSKEVEEDEDFYIKEINLTMIKCPAGSFIMGSCDEDSREFMGYVNGTGYHLRTWGFLYEEQPHWVTITKPFYIGKYEVTQKQYEAIMGNNPSYYKGDEKPVESVSWNDAKLFCEKLNEKYSGILPEGYMFDLPTEAQWEYACRAGTTTNLNSGRNMNNDPKIAIDVARGPCANLDKLGWYKENASETIHVVGQKKPNSWYIYDMHGNVSEWCRDWYSQYPTCELEDPYVDAINRNYCRVERGGSFFDRAWSCTSHCRTPQHPATTSSSLGFRAALVPVQ